MRDDAWSPSPNKAKAASTWEDNKVVHHTLNIVVGRFFGGGETSFGHRRYARRVSNIKDLSNKEGEGELKIPKAKIYFSEKYVIDIHPHNDDPVVITIRCDE